MSESEQSGAGRREVAYRLFASEFDDADFSYSESDEERAPNYVITPTGARVNRLFVVGVLTEVAEVSEDVLRARVVDPTGAFVLYAGQYQPDEQAFLDGAQTPMFVALTGKARTFQPDDSDQIFTSVRPESISEVDAATRDRWTVQTAEQTIDRVGHMATGLSLDVRGDDLRATLEDNGVDDGLAAGIPLAIEHYGTTGAYLSALRDTALDAARLVAGELDEVDALSLSPGDGDDADLHALADTDVDASVSAGDVADAATPTSDSETSASADVTETAETSDADTAESPGSTDSPTAEADDSTPATPETETSATAESVTETTTADESEAGETAAVETGTTQPETAETDTHETEPSEPETVDAPAATAGGAESGTTEPTDTETAGETVAAEPDDRDTDDDIGDFEPGEFDLDEDEREEIEEEYGTEFQSGTDVPDPGEADIDTPDPEELAEIEEDADAADASAAASVDPEDGEPAAPEPTEEESEQTVSSTDDEPAETVDADDIDLEDVTVEVMGELDDGDGADREALIETVADRYGASPDDVEEAIQDALMGGRCYEPDDTTVKPI